MFEIKHPAWVAYKSPSKVVLQTLYDRLYLCLQRAAVIPNLHGHGFSVQLKEFIPERPPVPGEFSLRSRIEIWYGQEQLADLHLYQAGSVNPETLEIDHREHSAELLWLSAVSRTPENDQPLTGVHRRVIAAALTMELETYRSELELSFKDDDIKKSSKETDNKSDYVRSVPKELVDDLRSVLHNLGYTKSEVQIRSDQAVAAVSSSNLEITLDNLTKAALARNR